MEMAELVEEVEVFIILKMLLQLQLIPEADADAAVQEEVVEADIPQRY